MNCREGRTFIVRILSRETAGCLCSTLRNPWSSYTYRPRCPAGGCLWLPTPFAICLASSNWRFARVRSGYRPKRGKPLRHDSYVVLDGLTASNAIQYCTICRAPSGNRHSSTVAAVLYCTCRRAAEGLGSLRRAANLSRRLRSGNVQTHAWQSSAIVGAISASRITSVLSLVRLDRRCNSCRATLFRRLMHFKPQYGMPMMVGMNMSSVVFR